MARKTLDLETGEAPKQDVASNSTPSSVISQIGEMPSETTLLTNVQTYFSDKRVQIPDSDTVSIVGWVIFNIYLICYLVQ